MMGDTYNVVKSEVQAFIDEKPCDFMVKRYYATFLGREPNSVRGSDDPFVEVWADGSITLHSGDKAIFLYDDQWDGIVKAISTAMMDKEDKRKRGLDSWLEATEESKEFHGVRVSLSRKEVKDAISSCPIESVIISGTRFGEYTSPYIFFNKEWHSLGRTDLMDNVATGLCENKTAEEWREYYLSKAQSCMGGRIEDYSDGRLGFNVIDSCTDG